MDEEVKQDFLESLKELTFNSRPIIQTLTTIAAELKDFAPSVAAALDEHVACCAPAHKLPALYCMDSICKNVVNPYSEAFASRVYRIFTDAFSSVPEQVKVKLGELFQTWTQPQPQTGKTLFPHEQLQQIDDFLARQARGPKQAVPAQRQTQSGLLVEINVMLKNLSGNDKEADYLRSELERIQGSLYTAVDAPKLQAFYQQFEKLKHQAENYRNNPRKRNQRDRERPRDRDRQGDYNSGGRRRLNGDQSFVTGANSVDLGPRRATVTKEQPPAPSKAVNSASPLIPKSLFESLSAAGLIPGNTESAPVSGAKADEVSLDNAFLSVSRIDILYAKLYTDLPLQSANGKRFPDTKEGRSNRDAEQDKVFRTNQRLSENKSVNRCWFLPIESWINYVDVGEEKEPELHHTEENKIDLDALARQQVVVPEGVSNVCAICQDTFENTWCEDTEEWVWKNATCKDSIYMHATCAADPNNASLLRALFDKEPSADSKNCDPETNPGGSEDPVKVEVKEETKQSDSSQSVLSSLGFDVGSLAGIIGGNS